jgi:hypothetical protein
MCKQVWHPDQVTGPPRKNVNFRAPTEVLAVADDALEAAGWKREALLVAFLTALPEHPELLRLLADYRPPERPAGRPRRAE